MREHDMSGRNSPYIDTLDFAAVQSRLDVTCRLRWALTDPHIVVIDDFLTSDECERVTILCRDRLTPSVTVNADGTETPTSRRTSQGCFVSADEAAIIDQIEQRFERLTLWPALKSEPLNFLRYGVGDEFKAHHDFFDPPTTDGVQAPRGGQRLASAIIYLNDTDGGGATVFERLGLSVHPKRGSLLFFSYPTAPEDDRTLHASHPIVRGEKHVLVKWFREHYPT